MPRMRMDLASLERGAYNAITFWSAVARMSIQMTLSGPRCLKMGPESLSANRNGRGIFGARRLEWQCACLESLEHCA